MADYIGFGVTLGWDPAGGSSFTTIGQVFDIAPPGFTRTVVDVTDHASPGRWMESIKGLKKADQFDVSVIYDPVLATHDYSTGLLSDLAEDSDIGTFEFIFPDAATTSWTFPGFVAAVSGATPLNDKMTQVFTIEVSGQPTLA